jgi:hypothetical protein
MQMSTAYRAYRLRGRAGAALRIEHGLGHEMEQEISGSSRLGAPQLVSQNRHLRSLDAQTSIPQ